MTFRPGRAVVTLLLALFAVGCDATAPSPAAPTVETTFVPPPAGEQVLACVSIEAAECRHVADRVLAALPEARRAPFSIQVRLFGCPNEAPCPRSLAFREGQGVVEYPDGDEPFLYHLDGPPVAPVIELQETVWTDPIQPSSPRADNQGPFPFEVGHCGILHVVDFDGSFWVPKGQVDGEASALINADTGEIQLVNLNEALYTGAEDVQFRLARFPGAKRFQLCD